MVSTAPQAKPLTIALLAGELSGDNLGAPLMQAIRRMHPDPVCWYWRAGHGRGWAGVLDRY
jgi:lipid A disaccharide synthetase